MTQAYYEEDVPPNALEGETVAVLGYGIQGRAQALTLRDSGVSVVVGNRLDHYSHQIREDGFPSYDLGEAAERGSIVLFLLPDELQAKIYRTVVAPRLKAGNALVFAHGFSICYGLIEPPDDVDVLLLAPRMPGHCLRSRYLEGWGVPAFVGVEHDATGKAWQRLLGLADALGITRCAAIESSFAEETELDHFTEHVTHPLIFRALELAFETLVEAGYRPESALLELHGSGELGEILQAAAAEGIEGVLDSCASSAAMAGIAHHYDRAVGPSEALKTRMGEAIDGIRSGRFAEHLLREQEAGYPEIEKWREERPKGFKEAEKRLRSLLREPSGSRLA